MPKRVHFIAGTLTTLATATFFFSTVIVESFGSQKAVVSVKALIVMPGLLIWSLQLPPRGAAASSSLSPIRVGSSKRRRNGCRSLGRMAFWFDPVRHFA